MLWQVLKSAKEKEKENMDQTLEKRKECKRIFFVSKHIIKGKGPSFICQLPKNGRTKIRLAFIAHNNRFGAWRHNDARRNNSSRKTGSNPSISSYRGVLYQHQLPNKTFHNFDLPCSARSICKAIWLNLKDECV